MKDAHTALDTAVLTAYGFRIKKDLLAQLLALNQQVAAHFQRWLKNPAVRDLVCQDYVSLEERECRLREIFGLPPKPPEPAVPGSNPVKPNEATFARRAAQCHPG